jgi:hypothetical protein
MSSVQGICSGGTRPRTSSGGLWHTPGAKEAYLDEDFDRTLLSYLEVGE